MDGCAADGDGGGEGGGDGRGVAAEASLLGITST
jgi:hypothetical protein